MVYLCPFGYHLYNLLLYVLYFLIIGEVDNYTPNGHGVIIRDKEIINEGLFIRGHFQKSVVLEERTTTQQGGGKFLFINYIDLEPKGILKNKKHKRKK